MTGTVEFPQETDVNASSPPVCSRSRHDFDYRARAVLSSTLVMGTVVAIAPAIPAAVRSQGLLAALALWAGAVVWGTISAAQRARRPLGQDFATASTAVATVGVAVAVLAATQLEVIRVLYDRPALTWNIDWRFHLNHAQAIARYGGLDSA